MIRWVCAGCGVRVCNGAKPGTAPPGAFVAVRAGTLDDTSWLRPTAHFWTRSAQPWVALPEVLRDGAPKGLAALLADAERRVDRRLDGEPKGPALDH